MARNFAANKIFGSDQMTALSRMYNHGLFHEGTTGQVTTSSGLTLNVGAIPAGAGIVNGTTLGVVAGSTVTLDAADATNPRRDIVWVDTGGAYGKTTGTPAASPAPPALTAARLALAEIAVAANAASIVAGNITDMRQTLPFGTPRYLGKVNNQTVNNSAYDNDSELFFSVGVSEAWRYDIILTLNTAPATPGFQWKFAYPAGSTGLYYGYIYSSTALLTPGAPVAATVGTSSVGTSLSGGHATVHGWIVNSTNAGTVQLSLGQNVPTVTNTIVAGAQGSYLFAYRYK